MTTRNHPVEFDKDSNTLKVNRILVPEGEIDQDYGRSLRVPVLFRTPQNSQFTEMYAFRWYLDLDRQVYILDEESERKALQHGMLDK